MIKNKNKNFKSPYRKGSGLSKMIQLSAKRLQVFHYHTLFNSQNMHLNMRITQPCKYRMGSNFSLQNCAFENVAIKLFESWKERMCVYCWFRLCFILPRSDFLNRHWLWTLGSWNLILCNSEESSHWKRILMYKSISILLKYVLSTYIYIILEVILEPIVFPLWELIPWEYYSHCFPQHGKVYTHIPNTCPF